MTKKDILFGVLGGFAIIAIVLIAVFVVQQSLISVFLELK